MFDFSKKNVLVSPFKLYLIKDIFKETTVIAALRKELECLEFIEKNNDLYSFRQTGDLSIAPQNYEILQKFRNAVHNEFLPWVRDLTQFDLSDNISMTGSLYKQSDVLLCHDDELEERRIAFVFYLLDEEGDGLWEQTDGGSLDLFSCDDEGQPVEIVQRVLPQTNQLVFFEVTPQSFHQVSEVLSATKSRLSINGWLHGSPVHHRKPFRPQFISLSPPQLSVLYSEDMLLREWVNPKYFVFGVQQQVRETFQEESEIQLDSFFNETKLQALLEVLEKSKFSVQNQPLSKKYHLLSLNKTADDKTGEDIVAEFTSLLKSQNFFLFLTLLTNLNLHPFYRLLDSPKLLKDALLKRSTDCADYNGEENGVSAGENGSKAAERDDNEPELKRLKRDENDDETACSSSITCCVQERPGVGESSRANPAHSPILIRRWQHGCYTLLRDCDKRESVLDMHCFLFPDNGKSWSESFGGQVSYLAADEDDELLTVVPSHNCLALVYRDEQTLRFVKYINSLSKEAYYYEIGSCFYEPSSETD